MSDERKGLPSASAMDRITLCPGSHQLILILPEREEEISEDAARGTRIHAVLAGEESPETLNDEERECVGMCREDEEFAVANWQSMFAIVEIDETIREERMWLHDDKGEKLISGKPDLVHRSGQDYLILDYKTGRGDVVDPAGNLQLRVLAVLVDNLADDVLTVTVGIIQPHVTRTVELVTYDREALNQAWLETVNSIRATKRKDAPRVPGEIQCKYCPAKLHCDQLAGSAVELPGLKQALPSLDNKRLAYYLDQAKAAEAFIKDLRAEAKRRLEGGEQIEDAVCGYRLKPGRKSRKVTDPEAVNAAVGGEIDIMKCVSVSLPQVEKAVWEARKSGGAKKAAVMAELKEKLSGAIELTEGAPTLERYNTMLEGGDK